MQFSSIAVRALLLSVAILSFGGEKIGRGVLLLAHAADATVGADVTGPPANAETFSFDAQVDKMLHIVVNSLYQHNEVFLRELISNASDALDKIRYLLLTEPDKYKSEAEIPLEVKIEYDAEKKTLTIQDTGVGMTKEDMIQNLGTVARSGTTKFVEALKESGNPDATVSQIGQFGVGFYSAFLVADRVTVTSKNPLDPAQHVWESENGSSDFVIYKSETNTLERGTQITLHLKEDQLEYVQPERLRSLAQHYSEFVMYPISLRTTETVQVDVEEDEEDDTPKDAEKKDLELDVQDEAVEKPKKTKEVMTHSWDVLNSNQAIWTREKEDITNDEYQAFFHVLTGKETQNATTWSHFNAEGSINFKSILYLPQEVPESYRFGNIDSVPGATRLYVRKVLIGDEFGLLPRYLGFIRGVVDSDDLPLNVNRETLQESKILQVIKKKLVRKAIDMIKDFAKESERLAASAETELDEEGNVIETSSTPKYDEWYERFSPNIKLGMIDDEPNRGKLSKLLRYKTSKSNGKYISLDQYVNNMKDWQNDIYVLGGESVAELEKSPFLETFREKDLEVVYLTDAVDEYLVSNVRSFDGKKFVQASSENVKFKDEDEDLVKRREKAYQKKFQPLTKWLRKLFHGTVLRVQVAKRNLGSVPAIVTSSDFGNSANMERIMRAQAFQHGVDPSQMRSMKIFEINPRHPLIVKLLEGCPPEEEKKSKDDDPNKVKDEFKVSVEVIDAAWMLHDMAMLNGGFDISDTKGHNHRLTKMLKKTFELESLSLEPEINPPVDEDEPPELDTAGMFSGLNMEDFGGMGDFDMNSLNMMDLDDLKADA